MENKKTAEVRRDKRSFQRDSRGESKVVEIVPSYGRKHLDSSVPRAARELREIPSILPGRIPRATTVLLAETLLVRPSVFPRR